MEELIPLISGIVSGVVVSGLIGAWVGSLRGCAGFGVFLGCILGPLGWAFTLLCEDARPRCRECLGVVPSDARKCLHCGSDLHAKPKQYATPLDNCPLCGKLVTTGICETRCSACGTAF
jgi:hypothetical protein